MLNVVGGRDAFYEGPVGRALIEIGASEYTPGDLVGSNTR